MRNIDKVMAIVAKNPLGIDDDEISERTGIAPRQQVYQLCTKLAAQGRIERRSVEKEGKRRKIHNFPAGTGGASRGSASADPPTQLRRSWERRLAALEAATGMTCDEILDKALSAFAHALVKADSDLRSPSGN
jgi:hypothetical protein